MIRSKHLTSILILLTACAHTPARPFNAEVQESCSAIFRAQEVSVVREGTLFTFRFSQPVDLVYSINGDPLVLESSTVVSVTPEMTLVGSDITNGMMKNPPVTPQTSKQAYDSRTPYGFDRTLLATLPIQINEGDSLVVAHSEIPTGHFAFDGSPKISFIESAAVLTGWNKQDVCSSYVLSQNRVTLFRPSFSGVKQAFDGIHFRFDKLPIPIHIPNPPSVNLFLGSSPKLNLTSSSWAGEYWSPNDLGENYQAYLGRLWGERLLLAMGDSVNFEQKIELLVTAVQNQIDIVGVLKGGGGWPAEDGGGHQIGLLAQIRFFGHMFDQPDLAHPLLNDGKFTEHNGQFYLSGPGFFYEPNQKSLWRMSLGGAPLMEQSALSWDATARHSMLYLACCTVSQSMAGWMALSILGVFDSQNDPADKQLHDFTKWYFAPISPQFQVDANIPGLWSSVSGIAAQLMPQYGEAFR